MTSNKDTYINKKLIKTKDFLEKNMKSEGGVDFGREGGVKEALGGR